MAQFAANQILIQNGKGLLRIPPERNAEFFQLLVEYYETKEDEKLVEFIYTTSIQGKRFVKTEELSPVSEKMFIRKRTSH